MVVHESLELIRNRPLVLSAFRGLLRATRIAFNGDQKMLTEARLHARREFRHYKDLSAGSPESAQKVELALGVTQILRENVVQGRNMGDDKYKLNIHEHTQRLDNDTAKQLKGTTKSFKDIKRAQF